MKRSNDHMTRAMYAIRLLALAFCLLPLGPSLSALSSQPSAKSEDTGKLIATLQGSASKHEKAEACRKLTLAGSKDAVPALAALLGDPELSAHARTGLEVIADPSAGDALRRALGNLQGKLRLGVVNSLGVRRDPRATPALARLAAGPDAELASAALTALGHIGTPEALVALRRALTSASAPTRAAAGEACLGSAERLLAAGNRPGAQRLYEALRKANVPPQVRVAALRGMIMAERSSTDAAARRRSVRLLSDALRSQDPAEARMALTTSRYLPGGDVTEALASEMQRARPQVRLLLMDALIERDDPGALNAIERLAGSDAPEVQTAAVTALGAIGKASSIPALLKALEKGREETAAAAAESLTRMTDAGADAALLERLPKAEPAARARLAGVIGRRGSTSAVAAMLELAADADPGVRRAAFTALVRLSRPGDLGRIVGLAAAERDASVRESADHAVRATAVKLPYPNGRAAPIIALLGQSSSDASARCALVGMLGQVGGYAALKAVKSALTDAEPSVRDAATKSLIEWPDASAAPALLGVLKSASDPTLRALALRGVIGLAGALASELPRPSPQVIGWLSQANKAIGTDPDERRVILGALGYLRRPEGLAMVQPYIADPNVEAEAVMAAVRIAEALSGEPQRMAKGVLEAAAATAKSEETRSRALEAAGKIAGDAIALTVPTRTPDEADPDTLDYVPIFDGTSLSGWEGDTSGYFRIEGSAIVGGSLTRPVPRNEFLCTARPYANFILRLECRLKSANGGIQIRSRRVPESPEVSGYQADMDSGGAYWGCLYDESRRGMLVQADQSKLASVVKKDDWNAYEIRCEGPRIRLYVNGVQTADFTEKDEDILLSGIIAVQVHGGPPSETWYRNIRIAELP